MSKELEALEKINHTICLNSPTIKWGIDTYDHIDCKDEKEFVKCYNIIEQALIQKAKQDKILDILKKKTISNFYIQWTKNYKDYNEFCDGTDYAELTQEEYDLLKEWLNG